MQSKEEKRKQKKLEWPRGMQIIEENVSSNPTNFSRGSVKENLLNWRRQCKECKLIKKKEWYNYVNKTERTSSGI